MWKAEGGNSRTYALAAQSRLNVVMLQENIANGQRIEKFKVELREKSGWKEVGEGTTVGYKRMLRFPEVIADSVRIRLVNTRLEAEIMNVAAYYAPVLEDEVSTVSWNNWPRTSWTKLSDVPLVVDLGKVLQVCSFTYVPKDALAKPDMGVTCKVT